MRRLVRGLWLIVIFWIFVAPVYSEVITKSGQLPGNETWSFGNTYTVTGGLTVGAGTTLTIEQGVVVKFQAGPSYIVVLGGGSLSAVGTSDDPIYFTDVRDDSTPDGDTNGDGSDTSPAAGSWCGLMVKNGADADLAHCDIRYAGGYTGSPYYRYNSVYKEGSGAFSLAHSKVSSTGVSSPAVQINGESDAVRTVSDCTVDGSGSTGIRIENATGTAVTLSGNTVINSGDHGIYVINSAPSIRHLFNRRIINRGYIRQ